MAGNSLTSKRRHRHGESRTPEYQAWLNIRKRCISPNNPGYKNYGGRDIKICDSWHDSYKNFLADMGRRPSPKHSIDRRDNNGNYEPGNCRWATDKQQRRNRQTNHIVTYNGRRMVLADACRLAGISRSTVRTRLKSGWDIDRALSQPPRQHSDRHRGHGLRSRREWAEVVAMFLKQNGTT